MKLNREDFLKVLKQAEPALSSQEFLPILTHYCFDGKTVTAFNDMQTIQIKMPLEFKGGLPGHMTKLLDSYKSETIELVPTSDTEVLLKCGKSKIKMALLPETMFLHKTFPLKGLPKIKLEETFKDAITRCLLAVGSDPTHEEQTGVCLQTDGGKVVMYSTDNQTISKCTTKCKLVGGEYEAPAQIVLPSPFCNTLISFLSNFKAEEVYLYLGEGFVTAKVGDYASLTSKVFLKDTRMLFEEYMAKHVAENGQEPQDIPEEFKSALERSLIVLMRSIDKKTSCVVEGNVLTMVTETPEGESTDRIEFDSELCDKKLSFKIDPNLIKRVIPYTTKIMFLLRTLFLYDDRYTYVCAHYANTPPAAAKAEEKPKKKKAPVKTEDDDSEEE